MKGAGFWFSFSFFQQSREGGRESHMEGREGKAGENDGGKESKFFPQMWFTSWSGKTSV